MRAVTARLQDLGLRTIVIGPGNRQQAQMLREDEGIAFELLTDPELKAYRAAGLRRGAARVFSWRSFAHLWRAWRKGFRQRSVQGDPWQLGGVLLIAPGGEVLYRHVSREAGDHAPVQEILAAAVAGR